MQCVKCHAELNAGVTVCPRCGTDNSEAARAKAAKAANAQGGAGDEPMLQVVIGFENTTDIQKQLKSLIDEYGTQIVKKNLRFIALMRDYLPEYDNERKLLVRMMFQNVFADMIKADDEAVAIQKAKTYMTDVQFLSPNAVEFVLVCFTYALGWHYDSPLREKEEAELAKEEEERKRRGPVFIDANVYAQIDALRYRLAGSVNVPDGYTKIDNFCFDRFGFMRSVKLPSSLLGIGDYAFSECKRLKGIEIPPTVRMIGEGAFSQCSKLAMVKIPDGIHEIADCTFQLCTSLEVVEVPSSVSSIGVGAFRGCESLKKLFLPESVKYIEDEAFAFCDNLTIHCYKNSYVHKYCLTNKIKVETVSKGVALRNRRITDDDD